VSTALGYATDWQVSQWITGMLAGAHFASLHYQNPIGVDPLATEVPGVSYSRPQITFVAAGARAIVSTNDQSWRGIGECVVTHLGIWDQMVGGNLRYVIPLPTPVRILVGAGYTHPAGELYIRWP